MNDPHGTLFFESKSGQQMRLLYDGPNAGWIVVKKPSGRWEFLRESTEADRAAIGEAVVKAHHEDEGEIGMSDSVQAEDAIEKAWAKLDVTKWRVWSWHEGDPLTIVFDNGRRIEAGDADLGDDEEAWYVEMCMESSDDMHAAGWKVSEHDGEFYHPDQPDANAPTRWRPLRELPAWLEVPA